MVVPYPEKEKQSIILPLVYVNGHTVLELFQPTPSEIVSLPIYDLTSDDPWISKYRPYQRFDISRVRRGAREALLEKGQLLNITLDDFLFQDTSLDVSDLTMNQLTIEPITKKTDPEQFEQWKKTLYINDDYILQKTLDSTTQLAITEIRTELLPLKQHEKRRIYKLRRPRLAEEFYTDTAVAAKGMESVRGYKYFQVHYGKISRYIHVGLMKSRDEYKDVLQDMIMELGIPDKIISDRASELFDENVMGIPRRYGISYGESEPYHQHQVDAKQAIRDFKKLVYQLMSCQVHLRSIVTRSNMPAGCLTPSPKIAEL